MGQSHAWEMIGVYFGWFQPYNTPKISFAPNLQMELVSPRTVEEFPLDVKPYRAAPKIDAVGPERTPNPATQARKMAPGASRLQGVFGPGFTSFRPSPTGMNGEGVNSSS